MYKEYYLFRISDRKKFLIFNVTGDRDSEKMLEILNQRLSFDMALFTPNISSIESNTYGKNYIH